MAVWLGLALGTLATLAGAQQADPSDGHAPEDEYEFELPPEDKAALELGTCRAWHGRGMGFTRALECYDHTRATLSFECESHTLFRKFPLHSVGDCYRTDAPWHCRNDGLSIDLKYGKEKYWVQFGDIPPQTAVGIVEYLRKAKWQRKPVRKELAETMTLHQRESRPDEFWLEIEYNTEHDMDIVMIPVTRECRGRRCRYRVTGVNHNRASFAD
jgi:hypothetical protein